MNRIFRKLWNVALIAMTTLAVYGLATSVCTLMAEKSQEALFRLVVSAAWLTVFALANEGGTEHE